MDKEILQEYIEGKLDRQQNEDVARWLDADEKNMLEYRLLRGVYDATLWSEAGDSSFARRKQIRVLKDFLKVAAIFIVAFGCSYLWILKREKQPEPEIAMQTVYVPEGQRAEIVLADSTRVWLNAKTTLTFPNQFIGGERRVELDGEAYFEVTKDASKHFIVSSRDYQVTVLGTEFNMNAYRVNDHFEASLLKGSIEVMSNRSHEKVVLTPNMYVYAKEGKLIQAALQDTDQFLWKEGIIAFEEESVRSIFSKLELYYDVKIDVQNKKIIDFPYTGKFRTKDGVEHVLKVLQLRHKFTYTKDNDTNTIVIK